MVYHLSRWYHCLCSYPKRTFGEASHAVLSWLQMARLKLQPAKCELFKVNVVYLGMTILQRKASQPMVVSSKLSKTGPFPSWLQSWETSWGSQTTIDTSLKIMLKLLTLSMIKFPVTMQLIRNKKNQWMDESQKAFDMLQILCTSTPILAFADFNKPFKLHTDARTIGLGAVLYQERDG